MVEREPSVEYIIHVAKHVHGRVGLSEPSFVGHLYKCILMYIS